MSRNVWLILFVACVAFGVVVWRGSKKPAPATAAPAATATEETPQQEEKLPELETKPSTPPSSGLPQPRANNAPSVPTPPPPSDQNNYPPPSNYMPPANPPSYDTLPPPPPPQYDQNYDDSNPPQYDSQPPPDGDYDPMPPPPPPPMDDYNPNYNE
jgi:hypothetical protein